MLINSHQEYFKVVHAYHKTAAEKRPSVLAGFVLAASMTHPDLHTRTLLVRFHIAESQRHAAKSQTRPQPG